MDRRTLLIGILLIFVSILPTVDAVVQFIQCPPGVCATVTNCTTVEGCKGRIEKTGFCGCCSRCVKLLAEGDSCFSSILLGVPATAECGTGLVCDHSRFVCVKGSSPPIASPDASKRQLAPCTSRLQTIQQSQSNGMPLLGVPTPVCDAQGYYAPVQCAGSQCYCATKDGSQIQTYSANAWEKSGMDCQCALDQHAYMQTGLIGKLFFCAPNGNYPPTSSATTVAVPTGPCATEAARLTSRLTASQNAGVPLLGLTVPKCDIDGYYQPKQCSGSQCYCVTKTGQSISGYHANRWEASNMNCQCARDKDDYQKTGLIGRLFNCMNNGNYQQYQCTGSVCYCVDDSGKQMGTQTVNIGSVSTLKCS